MDSEAETDVPEKQASVSSVAEPQRKTRAVKRDPNEDIPPNWQRKPHVADRMPAPSLNAGYELSRNNAVLTILEDNSLYIAGDCVFVARTNAMNEPGPAGSMSAWGAPPGAFRIARIVQFTDTQAQVNWFLRPSEVYCNSEDSRELYATFETDTIGITEFRGKCLVQCRKDIRMFEKYREKPSQFWFAKLYYAPFARTYDVVPVNTMRSLSASQIYELGLYATYAVLPPNTMKQLCETSRKKKLVDEPLDESRTEEELQMYANMRSQWPHRYFDSESREFLEPGVVPRSSRVGEQYQVDIPDWPGQPLVYYTMASQNINLRSGRGLRLVEPENGAPNSENGHKIDINKPWVQEMPRGYIPRGGDSTSTPVSLPERGLASFIAECQTTYAKRIDVQPTAVNFLDACCSVFVANAGNSVDDAFVLVSRLSRKQLREPDLQPGELATFKSELDPFAQHSWHHIFKAVGTKPVVELCQYYWVNLHSQPIVAPSQLVTDSTDPAKDIDYDDEDEANLVCAVCKTDAAPSWESLPGHVTLSLEPEFEEKKIALCSRCARLWYRYKWRWQPPDLVESLQHKGTFLEPELVDDMNFYNSERGRREKRRQAVQDKKEITAKKREEAKIAKKVIKAAKKAGKPVPTEEEALTEARASLEASSTPVPSNAEESATARDAEPASSDAGPSTAGPPTKKLKQGPKSKPKAKKAESAPATEADEDASEAGSEEDIEDSSPKTSSGKKAHTVSQLSLDHVEELLSALDEPPVSENAEYPNFCAVCGQFDPSMPQETCASCGLHVHAACYGASTSPRGSSHGAQMSPEHWFCDCCANSRGDYANDPYYQCVMCPPRTPCYGSWFNGAETLAPDVLKNTMEKSWCHLRCAVWTPGARFGNPSNYSDIDLGKVPKDLWGGQCAICLSSPAIPKMLSLPWGGAQPISNQPITPRSISSGGSEVMGVVPGTPPQNSTAFPDTMSMLQMSNPGTPERNDGGTNNINANAAQNTSSASNNSNSTKSSSILPQVSASSGVKVKCEFCDDRFHISCAADKGYSLGFTRDNPPRPVIVCQKHVQTDLVPMSRVDLNLSLSVMQKYVSACKVSKRRAIPVLERVEKLRKVDDEMRREEKAPQTSLLLPLVPGYPDYEFKTTRSSLKCSLCEGQGSSYWHILTQEVYEPAPARPSDSAQQSPQKESVVGKKVVVLECPLCFREMNVLKHSKLPSETGFERLKKEFASKLFLKLQFAKRQNEKEQ